MNKDSRTFLVLFFGIAGAALIIILGFYVYAFAPDSGLVLSRNSEDWARFGEYVGGTLGSIFGLLAFGGVLFTIREQRRQSTLEELQRQMSAISARVESILAEEPAESGVEVRARIESLGIWISMSSLLSTVGIHTIAEPDPDSMVQSRRDQRRDLIVPTIKRQLAVVQIELQHLVWCIEQYSEMGGSETLRHLYRRMYDPTVCWMHVIGLVEADNLKEFFQPERFRAEFSAAVGKIEPPPPFVSPGSIP